MYMRLLQTKVDPEKIEDLHSYYDQTVIPALKAIPGCMFANLIRSNEHPEEFISMTLWDNQAHAEAYGKSDTYRTLVENVKPFLTDSTEWKVQLSKDLTLEVVPVVEEPAVKSYSIEAVTDNTPITPQEANSLYVRIVVPTLRAGEATEFRRVYSETVIPALRGVKGCRYAYLTEGAKDTDDILSITVWDSPEDAAAYEKSPLYQNITERLKHTFSDVFQWKMGLERSASKDIVTSEDTTVEHYQVVAGARFGGH